jgi:bifunctional non-homologous end joining protein LigD
LPAFIEPSLALLTDKPPRGPQWVHELKFDGYRIQARTVVGS